MIDQIIVLIVYIILFAIVAWGLNWVVVSYNLPQPIRWLVGGLLLVILLLFLAHHLGVGGGSRIFVR
jgi:hypothetical protein